jgi:thioredoxin-dependent peroxiredoxin
LPSWWLDSGSPDNTRNGLMIEPPKATKGRRMSKKSRKKSSMPAARPPAGAKPAARAKTKTATSPRPAAGKSRKSAAGPASHKGASKRLKISAAAQSKSRAAKSRAAKAGAVKSKAAKSAGTGSPAGNLPALVEGAAAPEFCLPRDGGSTVSLSDFAGRKLVLFFYPRADTPGCTREAIDFTRLSETFSASGTVVLGISADSLKAQEKFRDKHELSVPLISDEQHEMLEAYGAWGEKSMYGKTFLGIIRSTVLIGPDGRVAKIWRNVKVDGHADEVLAVAQGL